ncbi:GNAT family N-acetyltransferase [Nocardia xishanensis]|uniref:GNAT family N-acetyltransferase n=1 Tax=Nocardia xishanensis TaxID=238964 RepID=UPI00082BF884|nr:GNAT family N-acetyltransferase [Nocardia xishanensis]
MAIVIRPGRPDEAALLSDLALRSKGFWGYSEKLLDSFRRELALSPSDVVGLRTAVAELRGTVVGFVTVDGSAPTGDLGMLFVVPEAIGNGVGTELFRHAVEVARGAGFRRLVIESDPNAEPFYRAMGAIRVGSTESGSVPGRELPLLEVDIVPIAAAPRTGPPRGRLTGGADLSG